MDNFPDSEVLIIEKAPEEHAGGNSRVAGQSLMIPGEKQSLLEYQRRMSEPNPIPEDVLEFWAEEMCNLEPWIRARAEEVGAKFIYGTGFSDRGTVLEYPEYGASDAVAHSNHPAHSERRVDRIREKHPQAQHQY